MTRVLSFLFVGMLSAAVANGQVINEFVADHIGGDSAEFVEIFGAPNTDYSNLWIVEIEGDAGSTGLIDDGIFQVGTTDANGFWTTPFGANVIENGNITLLLVSDFTGAVDDDLDTDDDGVLDVTPWSAIIDGIASSDGGDPDDRVYALDLAPGFDGSTFQTGGASRIPNGVDTDTIADWVRNDFFGEGLPGLSNNPTSGALNTPGASNELAIPEPGSAVLALLAASLAGAASMRSRLG